MRFDELNLIKGADWPKVDRTHRPDVIAITEAMPAVRALGIEFVGLASGRSIVAMPTIAAATFDGRHIMGGVTGTLADVAAVSAITAAQPEGMAAATVRFEVELLAPAAGVLVAIGSVEEENPTWGRAEVFALRDGTALLVGRCRATAQLHPMGRESRRPE